MASPIYFFPRVPVDAVTVDSRPDGSFLYGRGVAAAFNGVREPERVQCIELRHGPGNSPGVLLSVVDDPLPLGFFPNRQTWLESPAGCNCWLGIENEHRPTPADLAKPNQFRGHEIELADGQFWNVPIVRSPLGRDNSGRSELYLTHHGGDGWSLLSDADVCETRLRRTAAHDELWDLSAVAWDAIFADRTTIDVADMLELIVKALAVNYRIGRAEQHALRLVNSTNWCYAIAALLDSPLLRELDPAAPFG